MKKTALILMLITILSKILGFTRDIILSYYYGASNISDAYLIAVTFPTIVFAFIGTGITTSYIPIYSTIIKKTGPKAADRFTNNIINYIIILCSIIVLLSLMFTPQVVKFLASGFEGETLLLTIKFTRISVLGIYLSAFIYIFSGYLQLKDNFYVPALMSIPLNIFILASIILSVKISTTLLPIGIIVAMTAQLALLIPFVYKNGYRYRFILDRKDKYLRKIIYLSLPVIVGVSVNQINVLVDRTIASQISIGGISALTYASRLILFIQSIFVISIVTIMYPKISKMAIENNISLLKKSLSDCIGYINLLVVPTSIGAIVFAEPIVRVLFGRGAFDPHAVSLTSHTLFFYSLGLIGLGLREILSKAFYSLQDTKTPMINASLAMVMNIILNIILSKFLGIGGLALATSISAVFCTLLLFYSLRKKIGSFGLKRIFTSLVKILSASLIMGLISKSVFNSLAFIILNQILLLLISVFLGMLAYFIIVYFLKIENVDVIVNSIKRKLFARKIHFKE